MKLVKLGAATLDPDTGALLVQAKDASVSADDENAAEDFGNVPNFCALGLTAIPYPADDKGHVEGLVDDSVPGLDGVLVGARDTRTAKIVGNGKPGDTVLHSTGPQQAAQVQLKEEKRQAVFRTKDTRDKDAALIIDGKADKLTIAAFGHIIEMSRDGGIVLTESGGASLILRGGMVSLVGKVVLGGLVPFAPVHSGAGAGPTSIPTAGVFVGV